MEKEESNQEEKWVPRYPLRVTRKRSKSNWLKVKKHFCHHRNPWMLKTDWAGCFLSGNGQFLLDAAELQFHTVICWIMSLPLGLKLGLWHTRKTSSGFRFSLSGFFWILFALLSFLQKRPSWPTHCQHQECCKGTEDKLCWFGNKIKEDKLLFPQLCASPEVPWPL